MLGTQAVRAARLAAVGGALAALSAGIASLLAHEATAQGSQASLQAAATAPALSWWRSLLVLHLLLRRIAVAALLGRSVSLFVHHDQQTVSLWQGSMRKPSLTCWGYWG